MINLEYRKGGLCAHKAIPCQEGYCSGCAIYMETSLLISPLIPEQTDIPADSPIMEIAEISDQTKVAI